MLLLEHAQPTATATAPTTTTSSILRFLHPPPTLNIIPQLPWVAQVYLELASKALENLSAWAGQGNGGIDFELDGTPHDGGENEIIGEVIPSIRSMSPGSLLSSAEMYIDQALVAGSGLPLARLVKGEVLALGRQHQVCPVFQLPDLKESLPYLASLIHTVW